MKNNQYFNWNGDDLYTCTQRQKQQVADELLNELSNNREAVEETMRF